MNVQEYISSGILEQYVSGLISPQEKQEVECMSHIYPEIKEELDSLHAALEAMALDMRRTPPAHLKNRILDKLHELNQEEEELPAPLKTTPTAPHALSSEKTNNIRSINPNWWQIAAAMLLFLSVVLGYRIFTQQKDLHQLQDEIALQKTNGQQQQNAISKLNKQIAVMGNDAFRRIQLTGIPEKSPSSMVSVYWNNASNEVYIAHVNLPKTPVGKQYQLWAIEDGKPVDIGMISADISPENVFQQMKNISHPEAFAITLEKEGGVPSPTMSEMYVLGKI